MVNILNSQDFRYGLFKYLAENYSDCYFFSPICGLGDRSTFYSLISEFELAHGAEVRILCFDGIDPLLDFFPDVRPKVIAVPREAVLNPLSLTHWVYGANRPMANEIYFTWHRQYLDGKLALSWEGSENQQQSHKNLIRHILGLPHTAVPKKIHLENGLSDYKNCVVMSPIANSYGFSIEPFIHLAGVFLAHGIRVLWNVENKGMTKSGDPKALVLEKIFTNFNQPEILECGLPELLEICAGTTNLTISSRSGLCELLALSEAKYGVLQADCSAMFWTLNDWGRAPVFWASPEPSNQNYIDSVLSAFESINC